MAKPVYIEVAETQSVPLDFTDGKMFRFASISNQTKAHAPLAFALYWTFMSGTALAAPGLKETTKTAGTNGAKPALLGADRANLNRALALFAHNNAEAAAEALDKCSALKSCPPPTLVHISQIYFAASQHKKSIAYVNAAFDEARRTKKPMNRDCELAAYTIRAQANHAADNLDGAVADYIKCSELKSDGDPAALAKAGDILTRQKKYEQAIKIFNRSISRMNNHADPGIYLYRGICYKKMGRLDDAIKDFTESLARGEAANRADPTSYSISRTNCYVQRAECYDKLGKPLLAKADRQAHEKLSRIYEDDLFGKR